MKKYLCLIAFTFFVLPTSLKSENSTEKDSTTRCTFLINIEASGELNYWSLKNVADMAFALPNKEINILVQWHLGKDLAWRFLIEHKNLKLISCLSAGENIVTELVDSIKWAVNDYPAEHYCWIWWNHGFGILDPHLVENSSTGFYWEAEVDDISAECTNGACPLRGILFDDDSKTYLTNSQMVEVLKETTENVLHGKKLDILGADCCKMAMFEVDYQIKDYVDYFIGSQNCEIYDGWDYKEMFSSFGNKLSPEQIVKNVVKTYDTYYKKEAAQGIYTLSAVDLSFSDQLTTNINKIVSLCKQCMEIDHEIFKQLVINARSRCIQMCDAPFYTDLDCFYSELLKELESQQSDSIFTTDLLEELTKHLKLGKDIITKMVVANATGKNIKKAKGVSIYFPKYHIDNSYIDTLAAKNTLWLDFLKDMVQENIVF